MDAMQYIQEIGSVLGVPATIFLTMLWTKSKKNEDDIKEIKSEQSLLKDTLNGIRTDVSYLRGAFDEKAKEKI